ncbi:C-factor, partial [Ophiophagus hannah]
MSDVTNLESIQAARKEVGKCVGEGGLTILYNNAGIWGLKELQTENAKNMMRIYSVDTIGPLLMSQKAAWRSPCQGLSSSKAAIINMSSITGSIELMSYWDFAQAIGYRCSKAALNMLTKCQSLEYATDGIMSVAIHPGSVKTTNNPIPEISIEESTRGIMTVLSNLCEDDNGTFLDWLGCRLPCILVTGSNRGVGLGLVKRFLELPCPPKWVFATSRDMEGEKSKEVRELSCKHPNLVVLQLDVTNLESIQAALKRVEKCVGEGGLTLLINNAGIWVYSDMETENAKDMMRVYSVNTIGPLQISQAFLPLLKKAAWRSPRQGLSGSKAAIINISSNAASVELVAYWNAFLPLLKKAARKSPRQGLSTSKAAIINISSSLGSMEVMLIWDKVQIVSYRCSKSGILTVAIHPGLVNTTRNPYPEITVEESTQGIVTVLSKLSEEDNGTFLDWLEMARSMDFCIFSVLVTGSDRGIGLGLVKRFLELPCPPKWVFATTLDLEGEETKKMFSCRRNTDICGFRKLFPCSSENPYVTNLESIQAAQKEVQKCVGEGGLTILYNNAGIWLFNTLETENAKDMMSVYSVNTIGTLQMSQAFLPLLKKAARRSPCQGLSCSKAAIINMSSSMGSIEFMTYWVQCQMIGYRCSK